MAETVTEVINYPLRVTYNSVVLGITGLGETSLTVERNDVPVDSDQYGASILNLLSGGENMRISMTLRQWNGRNLKDALPWSSYYKDDTDERNTIGAIPGRSALANGGAELLLHRTADADAVTKKDIKIYKAIVEEMGDVTLSPDAPNGFPITFLALVDTSKTDGAMLGEIGTSNASTLISGGS
ncbi:hypothetical protein N9937_00535 [bacterium]|nr:hypothetical protein [bacterium]